jgi:hypothetical protein
VPSTKSRESGRKKQKAAEPTFACGFCNKEFKRENSLAVHMCPQKMRNSSKDDKNSRMAFRIWLRYYEVSMRQTNKTWDDFIRSQFYNDFLKIGKHINEINAVNTPQFIDFLIRSGIPLTKWTHQAVYETYIRELTKKETPDAAIERCISLMQQWAGSTGEHWADFFRKVAPAQATLWIKSGRLSPWVIYLSGSSAELFDRMSPEQLGMVRGYLDPSFWSIKIDRHKDEADFFRQVLDEAGV